MRGFSQCYIEPACIIGGTFIRPLILWSPKLVRVTYMQFSDCNGSFMKIYKGFRNLCMFWLFIVLDILCLIYCKPKFLIKYFVFGQVFLPCTSSPPNPTLTLPTTSGSLNSSNRTAAPTTQQPPPCLSSRPAFRNSCTCVLLLWKTFCNCCTIKHTCVQLLWKIF